MSKLNLILAVILTISAIQDIGESTFWPCESNDDCTAAGSTCDSVTSLCICNSFDSVFSADYTKCLTTSLFGDTCVDTVQCNLMPSGANCKSGVCDCADGHAYVRGRCRPLNSLEQTCETDLDCYFGYDRQSVSCHNNVCACANGYYRRYGNICRRKSMEIDDACVVNTDCDDLGTNVKCVSLKCEYVDELPTAKPNEQTTEPTTESLTEESTKELPPSTELPTLKEEEYTKSTNKKAKTKADPTSVSTPLLKIAQTPDSSLDTPKVLTNGGSELITDTETETESAAQQQTRKSREIAVQTSFETYELNELKRGGRSVRNVGTTTGSTSSNNSRRTSKYNARRRPKIFRFDDEDNIKTYSTLSNTDDEDDDDDDEDESKYGAACLDNGKSCVGLSHSICANRICLCRPGYYPKSGRCLAELGEIAESIDECEYAYDALSKTCLCQKNYFFERDLRNCRKPIQFHLSCTSSSQCSPFGAAYCHAEIPRRCTCEEYAEYDALQQMCVYKQGLGAECETNDGCPVTHSVCSNRICVCKANFYEKDAECAAGIGADCLDDVECAVENAVCQEQSSNSAKESDELEKTCHCRKGFVHFKDECLKEAEEIEEECVEDEQCKPLLAKCTEKKCSCTDEQHLKNGRCETKKELGEACSKATECFVEKDADTVECRNSVCQCKFGFQPETGQKHCIRVLPNKKNSSGRPSALKIITFVLIGSAFLITSAALKQAYY